MTERHIFVPAPHVQAHPIDAAEFGLIEGIAEVNGLMCPGSYVSTTHELGELLLSRFGLTPHAKENAIVGNRVYELACAACESVIITSDKHPSEGKIDELSDEVDRTLCAFGRALGMRQVCLNFVSAGELFPPLAERKGWFDIVIGSGPIGRLQVQRVATLCGVRLTEDGDTVPLVSHVEGYGGLVRDDDNVVVAQIVGSTFYLTLPSREDRFVTLYSLTGADLLRKALWTAWNRRNQATVVTHAALSEPAPYVAASRGLEENFLRLTRKEIEDTRLEVDELEAALRTKIRYMGEMRKLADQTEGLLKSPERDGIAERAFMRLQQHRLIEKMVIVENKIFEIWTKPVFIEHERRMYGPLGPYVIMLFKSNSFLIRCRDFPHEGKYVHPHIPLHTGSPCLGNATRAIEEALIGYDRAFGIELLLDWLENGYDHSIAETKITNWPLTVDAAAEEASVG